MRICDDFTCSPFICVHVELRVFFFGVRVSKFQRLVKNLVTYIMHACRAACDFCDVYHQGIKEKRVNVCAL